ncbi:MAG: hypothetical protein IPJ99_01330, partial [Betaproteobacteria bacterium]|nr:hypothetical protein [Betaproteobacteria bacterium]
PAGRLPARADRRCHLGAGHRRPAFGEVPRPGLDGPAIGLAGAVVVALWALGLVRDTAAALLDASPSASLVEAVRGTVAAHAPSLRIADLHVWRVGIGRHACIVALQGLGNTTFAACGALWKG